MSTVGKIGVTPQQMVAFRGETTPVETQKPQTVSFRGGEESSGGNSGTTILLGLMALGAAAVAGIALHKSINLSKEVKGLTENVTNLRSNLGEAFNQVGTQLRQVSETANEALATVKGTVKAGEGGAEAAAVKGTVEAGEGGVEAAAKGEGVDTAVATSETKAEEAAAGTPTEPKA